ncbi:MAG: glutaredoxin family protein [Pseudomonadales bacterium]
MRTLTFYTTAGCHLCEQAAVLLAEVQQSQALLINPVDIADSDRLIERYGIRIPVVRLEASGRELGWPFSIADLVGFLNEDDPTPDFTASP